MRSSRIQLIENTTERISRILSDNYGIQVIFKGDMCCTDGKRIFLPVIGDQADEDFLAAIPGLVDHESSHVLHSDFGLFKKIDSSNHPHKLFAITNICEDARVDAAMIQKWRGCKANLEKTTDWASKKLLARWDKLSEWGKLTQMCAAVALTSEDHWFVKEVSEREPKLWGYVEKVAPLLLSAKNQTSSQDSLDLAQKILDALHDAVDSTEKKEEEDSQEFTKKSLNSEAESCSTRKLKGDTTTSEDEKSTPPECLNQDFDPSAQQDEEDAAIADRQQLVKAEALKIQQQSRGSYMIYSTERDVIAPITKGDHQRARQLLYDSQQITNVLRTKMMSNLLANNYSRREPGKERGRIDHRSLFRVSLETSKKVFWQKSEAAEFNTRVSLWIDHSGSMQGERLRLAASSALLFGEVLNSLRIPFEVCGFSTSTSSYQGEDIYLQASDSDKKTFTRWGGLWIGVYKSFEEQWQLVKHRCSKMEYNQHDNTFDGECLRIAAQRLLSYPEPRRILFWFNDGEPCPNVAHFIGAHEEYLHHVAKEVEKVIEVFAIGIGTTAVKRFFSNTVTIHSIRDLPKVMLGELDHMLRKNQQVYARAAI